MSLSSLLSRVADQAPTSTDGRIIVIVAIVGALSTVAAAWAQGNRIRRQATEANEKADVAQELAAEVADSVGPKNGAGTVQEIVVEILGRLHSMQTSIDSIVTGDASTHARLQGHDREHAEHRRRIARLEARPEEPQP